MIQYIIELDIDKDKYMKVLGEYCVSNYIKKEEVKNFIEKILI
jgi:hypothetical protein